MPTTRRDFLRSALGAAAGATLLRRSARAAAPRPNIVLVMTDDQGWGEVGYRGHPLLKTPHLDAMAANGLRLDRFYAAGPVCSPTRASVLTGRTHDRSGTFTHGYALRRQERTLPAALKAAGYATGHFGKWHLNGLKGPGAPILANDTHHPGVFGFDHWLSVTNFFDRDPLLSRQGEIVAFQGDPSEVIVREAIAFMRQQVAARRPFFTVVWTGSPHSPWRADEADRRPFATLSEAHQHHYGELVAFDRSVGALRAGLRELGVADNTLVWYCSDNGGLPGVQPPTTGGLRGFKGSVYEGGVRVPGIIEWPAEIRPRVSEYPASTMDIFPTLVELLGLPASALLEPVDGASLRPLFAAEVGPRAKPIGFHFQGKGAWLDNHLKLVTAAIGTAPLECYDLAADPTESKDLAAAQAERFAPLRRAFLAWHASVEASIAGRDYPEQRVRADEPPSRDWRDDPRYAGYLAEWRERPEYRQYLARVR